jgi:hypothetical protein
MYMRYTLDDKQRAFVGEARTGVETLAQETSPPERERRGFKGIAVGLVALGAIALYIKIKGNE